MCGPVHYTVICMLIIFCVGAMEIWLLLYIISQQKIQPHNLITVQSPEVSGITKVLGSWGRSSKVPVPPSPDFLG